MSNVQNDAADLLENSVQLLIFMRCLVFLLCAFLELSLLFIFPVVFVFVILQLGSKALLAQDR
jgi:hypothetical protein